MTCRTPTFEDIELLNFTVLYKLPNSSGLKITRVKVKNES